MSLYNYVRVFIMSISFVFLMTNGGWAEDSFITPVSPDANPWTHLDANNDPDNFQFVIVPDRTGGARPGVFERAMDKINLLQPEFVVSVGDLIEGYNEKVMPYEEQWDEFDAIVKKLQMPFFYSAGNHDITNDAMLKVWKRRLGRSYYHFVYRDVLFMVLDSEDPPDPPPGAHKTSVSPEQVAYFRKVLEENKDVRWTCLFFHRPMWMGGHKAKGFDQIESMIQDRPYTVFAGHHHRYEYNQRFGRDYYVLATAGGVSHLRGAFVGEMDGVAWVTMTDEGPRLAYVKLDGIGGSDIREEAVDRFKEELTRQNQVIDYGVITTDADQFDSITIPLKIVNRSKLPMEIKASFDPVEGIEIEPSSIELKLASGKTDVMDITVRPTQPVRTKDIGPFVIKGIATFHANGPAGFSFDAPFSQLIAVAPIFNQKVWEFEHDTEGWGEANVCDLSAEDGILIIQSSGADPFFSVPLQVAVPSSDWLEVSLRMKSSIRGNAELFWATEETPSFHHDRYIEFRVTDDGQWHEYTFEIDPTGVLSGLRIDPSKGKGRIEIDWIKMVRGSR